MTVTLFVVGLACAVCLLACLMVTAHTLDRERLEVQRLRTENAELMARVGYEYHLALGTPPPPVTMNHSPDPVDLAPRAFRMKRPAPLTREEREARKG